MGENFGGGTSLLSVHSVSPSTFKISFHQCTWYNNLAYYGSAVDVSPALFQRLATGHLPIPEFIDGEFCGHSILTTPLSAHYFFQYSGIFVVTKSSVLFAGNTKFIDNSDSALYLNSGIVMFRESSNVLFRNNTASRGGAIAAYGFTSIVFSTNSVFNFSHNYARELGAGIYYKTYDQHDFRTGRECFLKVDKGIDDNDNSVNFHNITVLFEGNTAAIAGSSIYATTLFPCFFSFNHRLTKTGITPDIFNFIGDVQFDSDERFLATNGRHFDVNELQDLYELVPGKLVFIPLHPIDEFNQSNTNNEALLVTFERNAIKADRDYMVAGRLRFYGTPMSNDTLRITQVAPRKVILRINLTMLTCPPGFYLDEDNSCKCSAFSSSNKTYYGILKCDVDDFHAYLIRGFWIGYIPSTTYYSENLYTAICPLDFCRLNSKAQSSNKLPSKGSELSNHVCSVNREGTLCGGCMEGYSPFFHSKSFECGSNHMCSAGIIFYILSELVPIVVLFTIVTTFDFSFTSGHINGFIFFSQVLESLSINTQVHHIQLYKFLVLSQIFYDIFNFDYFSTSELSFCLWRNATVIDVLAFKYITIIFGFALVLFLVLIMKYMKCAKIKDSLGIKERLSVIKGLSAFLIICYSQCTRTSFYILTPVKLRGLGGLNGNTITLFGGLPYLEGRHLFYAIVAILFVATIVVIPPLVLTLYPLLLHLLALCKLSEHWIVEKILKVLQIYRLKPLIDSFQGCYRDKLRFFAGLYFIYRVMILAGFSITRTTSQFYIISQFLLLVFLGIHSIVQPYKQRSHNVINSLIFLNLALINGCSIFIDVYTVESRENQFTGYEHIILLFLSVQVVLIYLPMLCFLLWMGKKLVLFVSWHCKNRSQQQSNTLINSSSVDDGLFKTLDYHKLQAIQSTSSEADDVISDDADEPDTVEENCKIIVNKTAGAADNEVVG